MRGKDGVFLHQCVAVEERDAKPWRGEKNTGTAEEREDEAERFLATLRRNRQEQKEEKIMKGKTFCFRGGIIQAWSWRGCTKSWCPHILARKL